MSFPKQTLAFRGREEFVGHIMSSSTSQVSSRHRGEPPSGGNARTLPHFQLSARLTPSRYMKPRVSPEDMNPRALDPNGTLHVMNSASALVPDDENQEKSALEETIEEHPAIEQQLRILHHLYLSQILITREFRQKQHELVKQYHARFQQLYCMRAEVVNTVPRHGTSGMGIPEFWISIMQAHPRTRAIIQREDEPALKCLRDIRIEFLPMPGFRIVFEFNKNDFFTNKILKKEFHYVPDEDHFSKELIYGKVTSCEIDWHNGKNLTERYTTDENGKLLDCAPIDSFFGFFKIKEDCSETGSSEGVEEENEDDVDDEEEDSAEENGDDDSSNEDNSESEDDDGDEEDDGDDDEESEDEDEDTWMEDQFELGELFKDSIIPYALQWYTLEAADDLSDDDDSSDRES